MLLVGFTLDLFRHMEVVRNTVGKYVMFDLSPLMKDNMGV